MPPSDAIALIKLCGTCRLAPYLDGNLPRIGWGLAYYADGGLVDLADPPITQTYADKQLTEILATVHWPIIQQIPTYDLMSDPMRSVILSFSFDMHYSWPMAGFDLMNRVIGNALWPEMPSALMYHALDKEGNLDDRRAYRRYAEILLLNGATPQNAHAKAFGTSPPKILELVSC